MNIEKISIVILALALLAMLLTLQQAPLCSQQSLDKAVAESFETYLNLKGYETW